MRKGIAVALLVGAWAMGAGIAVADEKKVAVRDDCDPADPAWDPTGGCALKGGDVTFHQFFDHERLSPLSLSVIGHPAWRNEPSYLKIEPDETVKVKNKGGRGHTFTKVAEFGGGQVPPLNVGLTQAPECLSLSEDDPSILPPGASLKVTGLSEGDHRFQCCIHPWMRMLIKVKPEDESSKGEEKQSSKGEEKH